LLAGDDGAGLAFIKGQWVEVDREKLQQAMDHWRQLVQQHENGRISFLEGMRLLAGAPADLQEGDEVHSRRHLRHPLEGHCSVGDLLQMVDGPVMKKQR
jgi:non-specific serine/threonine protein kinase